MNKKNKKNRKKEITKAQRLNYGSLLNMSIIPCVPMKECVRAQEKNRNLPLKITSKAAIQLPPSPDKGAN